MENSSNGIFSTGQLLVHGVSDTFFTYPNRSLMMMSLSLNLVKGFLTAHMSYS